MYSPRRLIIIFLIIAFFGCRENNVPTFSIEPTPQSEDELVFKVTSPTYSENWFPGTTQTIKWDIDKNIGKVDIILYRKDIRIMTIASKIENNLFYNWIVPLNLNQSHHYRIKVADSLTGSRENFSDYFYIIESP